MVADAQPAAAEVVGRGEMRPARPPGCWPAALRAIAVSFFALAAYVIFESARSLLTGQGGETSRVGIIVAAAVYGVYGLATGSISI